jgi:hypothetical protein
MSEERRKGYCPCQQSRQENEEFFHYTDSSVPWHIRSFQERLRYLRNDDELITALRTALEKGEGTLDKEATSHDDLFDSIKMSFQFWH